MKDVELKLISELMKNSRRSDRELARVIKVSQPTLSRTIKKLEKEGIVKEYTMIPDFNKLGYKILAVTLVKVKKAFNQQQMDRARQIAKESTKTGPFEVVMLERGLGLDSDGIFITYHENYSAYKNFIDWLKQFDFLAIEEIKSFLVSLDDEVRYRPLTFSSLANHVLQMRERKE